jgi:hypothetical protein
MEIALNAVWLVLAVASFVILARRLAGRRREYRHGPTPFYCVVALSCVLAILFPVISLSDDLQAMQVPVEEASPSRLVIKKCGVNDPSNSGPQVHRVLFLIPLFVTGVSWVFLENIAKTQAVDTVWYLRRTTHSRAPPSFLISQLS